MEWKEMDKKRRGILLTVMLLTPVTAFYLMQLIMGTKFVDVKLMAVAANGLWLAGVYWLLCSFTGYPVMSSLVVHLLSALWGMANYFVTLSICSGVPPFFPGTSPRWRRRQRCPAVTS